MEESGHDWPMVARLMARLVRLREAWTELGGFSDRCLRGDPSGDTLFLDYASSHGEPGLRLELRFDRGAARRSFPTLSICDFGDSQVSLMVVEGPPTPRFRELENAIWGVLYEEVLRFERAQGMARPYP